jgi:gliding motility-associated-like protein
VNDPPSFTSAPVTVAAVNEQYVYEIVVTDPDNENVTITAVTIPAWATLTGVSNGKARLAGRPPESALGNVNVQLQASDALTSVQQSFTIYVNVRPTVSSLTIVTEEDIPFNFSQTFFNSGYTDLNDNALVGIQITSLPVLGRLLLSGAPVKVGDTVSSENLAALVYQPNVNLFGADVFNWKAYDGYQLSVESAKVDISILSVNDPALVILGQDTLRYEVNGEPAFLDALLEISDPDDDSLSSAQVGFYARGFRAEMDLLEFENTSNIRGDFNRQSGLLELTGRAPVADYVQALRTIEYIHRNTVDPILEPKSVFFVLNDGETDSPPVDKMILLQYTFIEFDIPSGFTPNGDQANDTWIIDRPGGLEELDDAVISVYNKRGVLVFRTRGFDKPWDGTMNGQMLPADTYFFTIDLQLRNKKTYKGVVTILR